jgi:hypothetical protein
LCGKINWAAIVKKKQERRANPAFIYPTDSNMGGCGKRATPEGKQEEEL